MEPWYEVLQLESHLYVIRERLDLIEPRFLTIFSNIFLILGDHTCILFDTGSGYQTLKSVIAAIIGDRQLVIINSHNHFDHVGSNAEFAEVHIHRFDFKRISKPIDISFLKDSKTPYAAKFAKTGYKLTSSETHKLLIGDELFELGGISVKVLWTPGHTPGSISLLTSKAELFTGDTASRGAIYLPQDDVYHSYSESLARLAETIELENVNYIYPAHEDYKVEARLVKDLHNTLIKLDGSDRETTYDEFLDAYVTEVNSFIFVFPKDYKYVM